MAGDCCVSLAMTMAIILASRLVHQRAHPSHRAFQAGKDRLADQILAAVEFGELRDRRDRADIVIGQAVAGMGLDAALPRERGGLGDEGEFDGAPLAPSMAVPARGEFTDRRLSRHILWPLAR